MSQSVLYHAFGIPKTYRYVKSEYARGAIWFKDIKGRTLRLGHVLQTIEPKRPSIYTFLDHGCWQVKA